MRVFNADWRDHVRGEYEDVRGRFKDMSFGLFLRGDWFSSFVSRVLSNYVDKANGGDIISKYHGDTPEEQANHVIELAAKHCAVAASLTASLASAAAVSFIPTFGFSLPGIGATVGLAVMTDIGYSIRRHIHAIYDLSVIYGGPLERDEVEDCYLIFMSAMEVKPEEIVGRFGKYLNRKTPKTVTYNARMILRTGIRKFFQDITNNGNGNLLIRKLIERVNLRLLVPGVNVAIAGNFNRRFARHVLTIANQHMRWRGAVVCPLIQIYEIEPYLDPLDIIRRIIVVVESGSAAEWSRCQLDALRHCQSVLDLSDEELLTLDPWFQVHGDDYLSVLPMIGQEAAKHMIELLTTVAALFPDTRHDIPYAKTIASIAQSLELQINAKSIVKHIGEKRRTLFF